MRIVMFYPQKENESSIAQTGAGEIPDTGRTGGIGTGDYKYTCVAKEIQEEFARNNTQCMSVCSVFLSCWQTQSRQPSANKTVMTTAQQTQPWRFSDVNRTKVFQNDLSESKKEPVVMSFFLCWKGAVARCSVFRWLFGGAKAEKQLAAKGCSFCRWCLRDFQAKIHAACEDAGRQQRKRLGL
ncbi:MAG: uncharacterized protein A8A55_2252 [Amphiamblys sp. WSBS2006]|nr:MAG: uncharacterized protein A8A55_2252 [Amphiamblys sp. WSBS2006]